MVERYRAVFLEMQPFNTGAWVRFTDHESELAALRQRIEELERALSALLDAVERQRPRSKYARFHDAGSPIGLARAALGRKA